MSQFWQQAERKLRAMERDEANDLFAIGYLIPQVALAEEEGHESDEPFSVLADYVARCICEDQLSESDGRLIREVLQHLK